MTSSEEVVKTIRRLDLAGHYIPLHRYIISLSPSIKSQNHAAIWIIFYYVKIGYYSYAARCLANSNYSRILPDDSAIFDEEMACLALLDCFLSLFREQRWQEALAMANHIDEIYLNQTSYLAPEATSSNLSRICQQAVLWAVEKVGDYDDSIAPISDMRILIEKLTIAVLQFCCENGFLAYEETISNINQRAVHMYRFLKNLTPRRYHLEDMFVTFPVQGIRHYTSRTQYYDEYLDNIAESQEPIRFAYALMQRALAEPTSENGANATSLLDRAVPILNKADHKVGVTIVNYLRIDLCQHRTHSHKERLDQFRTLADEFATLGAPILWWRCVTKAIGLMELPIDVWPDFQDWTDSIFKFFGRHLNRHGAFEFYIMCLRCRIFSTTTPDDERKELEGYLDRPPQGLTPALKLKVYEHLIRCNEKLFDRQKASHYAQMAFDSEACDLNVALKSRCLERLIYQHRSEALHTISLGIHKLSTVEGQKLCVFFVEGIQTLFKWAKIDEEHGFSRYRNDKINLIKILSGEFQFHFPEEFSENVSKFDIDLISPKNDHEPHGKYVSHEILLKMIKENKAEEAVRRAQDCIEQVRGEKRFSILGLSRAYYLCACACASITSDEKRHLPEIKHYLSIQLDCLQKTVELDRKSGVLSGIMERFLPYLDTLQKSICIFDFKKKELFEEVDDYLLQVSRQLDVCRTGISVDHGINMFIQKREVVSTEEISNIYKFGCRFLIQTGELIAAWQWMQKAKGRALLDIIRLRDLLENDQFAALLPTDLGTLFPKPNTSSSKVEPFDFRQGEISSLNIKSSESHDRRPVDTDRLYSLIRSDIDMICEDDFALFNRLTNTFLGDRTAHLVDWLVPAQRHADFGLPLLVINCQLHELNKFNQPEILLQNLQDWIGKYLDFSLDSLRPLEYTRGALKQLQKLVNGLEEVTNPGDLIVLTPSAPLSSIPIHGLTVTNKPIIERNIVIYSSSLTLLKHCIMRSTETLPNESRSLRNAVFTAVYEEPGGEVEREKIFSHVSVVAQTFSSSVVLGREVTIAKFKRILETAPWIHFHGHADHDQMDGLNQAFRLSTGLESWSANANDTSLEEPVTKDKRTIEHPRKGSIEESVVQDLVIPAELQRLRTGNAALLSLKSDKGKITTRLTAADIFSMNLQARPFICCIACESGAQDVYSTNEPFGVISALFCAGAASVVATLWPIQSDTGREFCEYFYEDVREQIEEEEKRGRNSINLAIALSKAVANLRRTKSDPYSWAAFILHGAPLYRFR